MDTFEKLTTHPLRWFSRKLAFYSAVAAATAVAVIAAAGVCSLL